MILVRCPTLAELPPPTLGKTGWPWIEETSPLPDAMSDPSTEFRAGGSPWPCISIVTPSFNQGHYLEETIRSVLLQGYPDLEYIIIDGGSTDGSVEIIKKYEPWLAYWVSEPDQGQSHAINKGFARCSGDLITYQNSDDIYLPEAFHDAAVKWCECGEQVGAIIGGFHFMDPDSRLNEHYFPPRLAHPGYVDLSLGPPGIYRLHQVATFFTRPALDRVGRWVREDMKYVMDRELLYRICLHARIILADRAYGAFRIHENSKSTAEVLLFAKEFASLYLSFRSGNRTEDKRREQMARHHLAGGYMKIARTSDNIGRSTLALLTVLRFKPSFFWKSSYWIRWLESLRLKPIIKKLLFPAQEFESELSP